MFDWYIRSFFFEYIYICMCALLALEIKEKKPFYGAFFHCLKNCLFTGKKWPYVYILYILYIHISKEKSWVLLWEYPRCIPTYTTYMGNLMVAKRAIFWGNICSEELRPGALPTWPKCSLWISGSEESPAANVTTGDVRRGSDPGSIAGSFAPDRKEILGILNVFMGSFTVNQHFCWEFRRSFFLRVSEH